MPKVTVLIPTFNRTNALSLTLLSLSYQTFKDFKVIVSDQTEKFDVQDNPNIQAVVRVLESKGIAVDFYKNLPRRGMAEQRQFLLDKSIHKYSLFLDDDLILEPFVIKGSVKAIEEEGCGFVGRSVIGLSFLKDVRPNEQEIEFWEGKVRPETVTPGNDKWNRYLLHNASNLYHVEQKLHLTAKNQRKYKVAWVGGCVFYDTKKLKDVGGFEFWKKLPKGHCGEDVLAQLKVMRKFGGCGLIPSGVYHQELKTTIKNRGINAPEFLLSSLQPSTPGVDS